MKAAGSDDAIQRTAAHLVLGVAAGLLYLATLCPGGFWLDTSELIAGAHTLGVVHPPGHPLYVLLAKAAALLIPLGDIAFRINLLSAVLGVSCALMVAETVRALLHALDQQPVSAIWIAAAAGWLFAATSGAWMQSIRAEVYALNTLLLLIAIRLVIHWWQEHSQRAAFAFAVTIGLALCNHHYLVFFFLPAPLLMLLATSSGRRLLASRRALWACLLVLCGLLTYAYLPIRAAGDPVVNWGAPNTWGRFFDVLSAKTFQGSLSAGARSAAVGDNLGTALGMMAGEISLMAFLAAAGSLILLWLRARPIAILLGITVLGALFTKAVMTIDPTNPDDYGYILTGVAALVILAALIPGFARMRAVSVAWALALLLGGTGIAALEYTSLDLSRERSAETLIDADLQEMAPNATALVSYYSSYFNFWYAQLVFGQRPDVIVVQASFDSNRHNGGPYVASLLKRAPHLQETINAFRASGEFPAAELTRLSLLRPVYLEPTPENLMAPEHWAGVGHLWRIRENAGATGDAVEDDTRFWSRATQQLDADGPLHNQALKALSFSHFLQAVQAIRRGHSKTAAAICERAQSLGATSSKFDRLLGLSRVLAHDGMSERFRQMDASRMLKVN